MKRKYAAASLALALVTTLTAAPLPVSAAEYTQNDLDKAQSEISAANTQKSSASERIENLKKAVTLKAATAKKQAAYGQAQADTQKAQTEYDQVNSTVSKELSDAKAAAQKAQEAYDTAKVKFDEGVYGFYESRGSTDAINLLNNAHYASYTKKGDPNDATSLDNVKASFQWIRKCNELRASEGAGPLKVSDIMMAASESDTNWSNSHVAHAEQFNVGENLSWGYRDPFDGWYTEEKQNYISHNGQDTGHYRNIINRAYGVTGFSICTRRGTAYGVTHGQTFLEGNRGEDLDTYEKEFNAYYDSVNPATQKSAVDQANQKVSTLQAQLDTAAKTLNTAKETEASAQSELQKAEDTYNDALAAAGVSDGNLESALSEAQTQETNADKAIELLKNYTDGAEKVLSGIRMYRLYNPNSGEHFYTASAGERNSLRNSGWTYEGIGWTAPQRSNTPVYRLYNSNAGDHFYTTSVSERRHLLSLGWSDEGIGWYSDDTKEKPLYRQYNKNAKAGSHNYTLSKSENNHLVRIGWRAEGIGWYGIDTEAKTMPDVSGLLSQH